MLYASTKTLVRLAFALGAFALMALSAVPAAPRSAADDGGGVQPTATPAALADGKGAAVLGASPAPAPSAGGGKPLLDGDDDISPAILGGAKGAQVYPNLAASLDGVVMRPLLCPYIAYVHELCLNKYFYVCKCKLHFV